MITPEQQATLVRHGYQHLKYRLQEDGAIFVLELRLTIDRWGDPVRPGRLVGVVT